VDTDERLRAVELSTVRVEEKLARVEHDSKNTRQMLSSLSNTLDVRHSQLEADIKALSRTLLSIGLSLVGSIITLLVAVIAYFLLERNDMITVAHTKAIQQQETAK
jgi:hypothetical protein